MNQGNSAETGINAGVVSQDPRIVSGAPVFPGTRVPVRILQDWLENGDSIEWFLFNYPTVSKEQVVKLIEFAFERAIGPRDEDNPLR